MNDRVLEENLGALLRAADDGLSPADVDRACASFLGRVEPKRPRPWLALASAAALVLAVVIWGTGGTRAPAGQAAEIDRWIADLGNEDAGVRERAARSLGDLGPDLAYGLGALEKVPALPDEDARFRARRVAGVLRAGLGPEISHEDGPPAAPAPSDSKLRLEIYDVSDILETNSRTGEDLAQLIQSNVPRDRLKNSHGANMSSDDGNLSVRDLPEVHDAIRALFKDLRAGATRPASRPNVEDRIARLGAAAAAERDAAEARLKELGTTFAYALGALDRLKTSADADLRLRGQELRTKLRESQTLLCSHHAFRRAAIEKIRAEWPRQSPLEQPELVRKAFEPCRVSSVEIHADLQRSRLHSEAVDALGRGSGVVSLWSGRPFSFATLGARQTTLAFTVPGETPGCVLVRFER